jgi:hypothetical protein
MPDAMPRILGELLPEAPTPELGLILCFAMGLVSLQHGL